VIWILAGLGGLVVLWVVTRARKYGRIFADAHFIEVGGAAAKIKAAALAKGDSEPSSADDPRTLQTSANVAIFYTVRKDDLRYVHHCSVSVRGGPTTHAVGRTFVAFAAKLFGLPLDRMAFAVAPSTVHHGEVMLDADEHAAVAAAPVPEVSASNATELKRAAMDAPLEWKRLG